MNKDCEKEFVRTVWMDQYLNRRQWWDGSTWLTLENGGRGRLVCYFDRRCLDHEGSTSMVP